jgi:hypothetical protein
VHQEVPFDAAFTLRLLAPTDLVDRPRRSMVDHRRSIGCTAGRMLAVPRPIRSDDVTYGATDVAGAGQLNISGNYRT